MDQEKRDTDYSPASETETEVRQGEAIPDQNGAVKALPGTGGPDDGGDIEPGPDDPIYINHEQANS